MLPGRCVAARVEQDPHLRGIPFSGLYQQEYRLIDASFPYQSLTLGQLGIPERDVLYVSEPGGEHYLEMT